MTTTKNLLEKALPDTPIATMREIICGQQLRELESLLARHAWGLERCYADFVVLPPCGGIVATRESIGFDSAPQGSGTTKI